MLIVAHCLGQNGKVRAVLVTQGIHNPGNGCDFLLAGTS